MCDYEGSGLCQPYDLISSMLKDLSDRNLYQGYDIITTTWPLK